MPAPRASPSTFTTVVVRSLVKIRNKKPKQQAFSLRKLQHNKGSWFTPAGPVTSVGPDKRDVVTTGVFHRKYHHYLRTKNVHQSRFKVSPTVIISWFWSLCGLQQWYYPFSGILLFTAHLLPRPFPQASIFQMHVQSWNLLWAYPESDS